MPSVLLKSALTPLAVLKSPSVLLKSALTPLAVLLLPVVLLWSALAPLAVLLLPVVLFSSAEVPTAVVLAPIMTPGREILGMVPPEETKGAEAVTAVIPPTGCGVSFELHALGLLTIRTLPLALW